MPDQDNPPQDVAQEAARLEAALERIARASRAAPRGGARAGQAPADPAGVPTAEIAGRLDALIAQLRRALARTGE